MINRNDGGPAFPFAATDPTNIDMQVSGMSLRDWFAGHIAGGMAAFSGTSGFAFGPDGVAARSYELADAMLAERDKQEGGR